MLPHPLHPALVHLPLGLAMIMPLIILVVSIGISKQWFNKGVWILIVGLQLICMISGIVAIETGEDEEEVVQKVMAGELIAKHEDLAKAFTACAGVTFAAALVGFFFLRKQKVFSLCALVTFILSLATLGLAMQTGHLGGKLVYEHGAGKAYESTPHE